MHEDKPKKKKNISKLWECRKCKKIFPSIRILRSHRKEYHLRDLDELRRLKQLTFNELTKKFMCKTCSMEFDSKKQIEDHVKIHDDTFSCFVCSEQYTSAYKLSVHVQSHGDDNFKCPLCDYESSRKYSVLAHLNRKHYQEYPYNCQYCGKGFHDVVNHQEHELSHTGGGAFSCVVCNKSYPYSRYLLSHQQRSHKVTIDGILLPNQCTICKRTFSKPERLESHLKTHSNEMTHLCDICGKGFATNDGINSHYKIHSDVKPHACSYCPKAFTKKEYLVAHERVHSGERPFKCGFCEKGFTQRSSLKIHVRGHTGDKPYICHLCKSGFVSRGSLNQHYKTCIGRPT